jgi:PAS domain S-box-containing protein
MDDAALFARLFDGANDCIVVFDAAGRCTHVNAGLERVFGTSPATARGRLVVEVLPFLLASGDDVHLRAALDGNSATTREQAFALDHPRRSGWYDATYAPLRDDTGRVIGGVATFRDTSDIRRQRERLDETEARFKNMADVSPVMLWMSREDSLCTFFNQTWLEFTGRTLEQEWGMGWAAGIHAEDFASCIDTYVSAFNARRAFETEYRLRRADGVYRMILDRGTPRYTRDGTFVGFIGSCIDITDRATAERDLRDALRSRDDFLSVASHELRTPLSTLKLSLELIRLRGVAEPGLTRVATQIERLEHLVDALLDVSRISAHRLVLSPELVDLVQLAHEVAERFAMPSNSPIAVLGDDQLVGMWDRSRLDQILTNLISNAIKYGERKPIEVLIDHASGPARVTVRDHGIGISSEDQGRIFERFARAVSPRQYGGLGLGLWITKHLVTSMAGQITVDSQPGHGASFTVEVPLQ